MSSHESGVAASSLDELEREITELASHIHAATCRWLGLVAEFDRREGWAAWGCRSCAHWVSWRCGIAPAAAREHVRVARRLERLPAIRAAFAQGQLSYSKVRALTRVEGVVREGELLELARHASAAQLERLVRAYRGVVAVERGACGGRPERWLCWSEDDAGALLLRARLPAEEGALVIAALEAAVAELSPTGRGGGAGFGPPAGAGDACSGVPAGVSAERAALSAGEGCSGRAGGRFRGNVAARFRGSGREHASGLFRGVGLGRAGGRFRGIGLGRARGP